MASDLSVSCVNDSGKTEDYSMDIISTVKLLSASSSIMKDLLKKKDVDLPREIENLKILHGSLTHIIDETTEFYSKYLEEDIGDIEEFVRDFLSTLALLQSCKFLFKQTYLGNFITLSIDSISSDMEKLSKALDFKSKSLKDIKEEIKQGKYISLDEVKRSFQINICILEKHSEHIEELFHYETNSKVTHEKSDIS